MTKKTQLKTEANYSMIRVDTQINFLTKVRGIAGNNEFA